MAHDLNEQVYGQLIGEMCWPVGQLQGQITKLQNDELWIAAETDVLKWLFKTDRDGAETTLVGSRRYSINPLINRKLLCSFAIFQI